MNKQLYQVLRTYWQRKIVLLLGGIALLLAVPLFLVGTFWRESGYEIAPSIQLSRQNVFIYNDDWKNDLEGHPLTWVDSIYLSDSPDQPLVDLTLFTQASTLELSTQELTAERLTQIESLTKLQELELHARKIPSGTWTVLGSRLEMLDVPSRLLVEHADEMSQLTRLRVLRIERDALNPNTLSVVAKIPNLETLVLSSAVVDRHPGAEVTPPTPAWDPAQLAPLRDQPHLRSIFVSQPYPLARTTAVLPGVVLYHATNSRSQQIILMYSVYFSALISIIVALQIWAHFATQHSVIIPDYHRPHQLAALLVILGGSFVTMLVLINAGTALLPAVVLSLGIPALIMVVLVGSLSRSSLIRGICIPIGIFSGVMIWLPALGSYVSPTIAGEMEWFFLGTTWVLALTLLLVEGSLLAICFQQLPQMTRRIYEVSAMHPGFSPWDPQQQRRAAFSTKNWWQSLWDRTRPYPQLAGSSLWQQAKLWQMGNIFRPFGTMLAIGFGFLVVSYIISQNRVNSSIYLGFLFQMEAMALFMPLSVWYRRCRSLQTESLRPVSRPEFTQQLFAALARDQSWTIIPVVIGIGYQLFILPQESPEIDIRPFIPLPLLAMVWGYALSTSVFAIRQVWVLVGYFIAMILAPFVLIFVLALILDSLGIPFEQQAPGLYGVAGVGIIAAAVIVRLTYLQALRREWGYA
ncbi:hypothetical protein DTL42_13630 [Bremerella cremea]|uniref:Uncharacterized protein n=1 Tax=Bremerella cremea TaxID=1031537 RepID=A0A368KTV0_9BACT|nr:hypothetical protein [Bremerella cremea]RCS48241.1 hypothetical protein DTL42_13630 [Bremerella cremea]